MLTIIIIHGIFTDIDWGENKAGLNIIKANNRKKYRTIACLIIIIYIYYVLQINRGLNICHNLYEI